MATYTRDEFIRKVLIRLGVVDPTEAPETEDREELDQITQQTFEDLYEQGLIPFDVDGEIPARYFVSLRDIVANAAFPNYQFRDEAVVAMRASAGTARLYALRNPPFVPTPVQVDYF